MPDSLIRPDAVNELIQTARQCPPGDLIEVGVYKGGSASGLAEVAREQGRRLFLFDTFTGIPYAGEFDTHKVGDFSDTSLEEVQKAIPEARIYPGVFPETIPDDLGPIALAHIDCDQYQSVHDCCVFLAHLMVEGGVMVFDDYDVLNSAKIAVDTQFPCRVKISAQGKARVHF